MEAGLDGSSIVEGVDGYLMVEVINEYWETSKKIAHTQA